MKAANVMAAQLMRRKRNLAPHQLLARRKRNGIEIAESASAVIIEMAKWRGNQRRYQQWRNGVRRGRKHQSMAISWRRWRNIRQWLAGAKAKTKHENKATASMAYQQWRRSAIWRAAGSWRKAISVSAKYKAIGEIENGVINGVAIEMKIGSISS